VNTAALKASGIWEMKVDPEGGKILRDGEGHPTGVLLDTAMKPLGKITGTLTDAQLENYLIAAVERALSLGITGVHDAGAHPRHIETARRLLHLDRLNFRFYEMVRLPDMKELVSYLERGPEIGAERDRLTVRTVKLFIDGAMGSRGAAFEEPYADDKSNHGLLRTNLETLTKEIAAIDAKGFQVAIHAIGTQGNHVALEAMRQALGASIREKRPRLEHAQVLHEADLAVIARSGVIASMQPTHATSDMKWVVDRIGPVRARFSYAWRSVLKAGIPLAFGSDAPVEDINPWPGLFAAVTRQDENLQPPEGFFPEQRLTLPEAYRAFTAGAAFAGFAEKKLGSLEKGRWADLIILGRDPFTSTAKELREIKVDETYVGGEKAWPVSPQT
jgi:predicted amidohydrolase YtcJ